MRYVSSERLLDVVGLVLVGAAAASALTAVLKPSEFRAKSERIARLHQLEAMTAQAQPRTLTMAAAGGLVTVSVTPVLPTHAGTAVHTRSPSDPDDALTGARPEGGFVEHAGYQSPSDGVLANAR